MIKLSLVSQKVIDEAIDILNEFQFTIGTSEIHVRKIQNTRVYLKDNLNQTDNINNYLDGAKRVISTINELLEDLDTLKGLCKNFELEQS